MNQSEIKALSEAIDQHNRAMFAALGEWMYQRTGDSSSKDMIADFVNMTHVTEIPPWFWSALAVSDPNSPTYIP